MIQCRSHRTQNTEHSPHWNRSDLVLFKDTAWGECITITLHYIIRANLLELTPSLPRIFLLCKIPQTQAHTEYTQSTHTHTHTHTYTHTETYTHTHTERHTHT